MSDDQTKNLTGDQISEIMDTLLYNALEPVVLHTDIFDTQMVHILSVITRNKKRKLVALEREDAINILCQIHLESDRQKKFNLIRKIGIERSFIHCFIKRLLDRYKDEFNCLYDKFLTNFDNRRARWSRHLDLIQRDLGATKRSDLYLCFNQSTDYLKMFYAYQQDVAKEYVRLCSTQAKQHVMANPHNQYDFLDVRQGLLQNVIIALNKYDANKGALTSYIKWWMFNAQTCSSSEHEYGIAFTVPQGQKKKLAMSGSANTMINFSTSLDQIVEDDDGDSAEGLHNKVTNDYDLSSEVANMRESNNIMYLAKHADINGCARLTLDIGEVFSKSEKEKMRVSMREQGLQNT